jgi:hypothetical protein
MQELKQAVVRKPGFLHTLSAVLWSFFGVRRGRDHDADMASLNPVHVILTGLLAGVAFVLTLVVLVRVILGG